MTDHAIDPRTAALEWARTTRQVRHDVRTDVAEARLTVAEVLATADDDPRVAQVKVLWLLESLPGASKVATRRALAEAGIGAARRVGSLDATDRAEVLERFPLSGVRP